MKTAPVHIAGVQQVYTNSISATEVLFMLGLAFLFSGLWLLFSLGAALAGCGAVLIVAALLNDFAEARHAV